ncbi:MAG: SRPBCC family protein [Actinomycetia bacterium]|nr:SRPBCC family protein [Actinomycetes bacterium]MCP5033957.1 SRPBCC family protein [Actinomycetes bacterium]
MRNIKIERAVAAQQSSVWAVLADYPNISDWNDGVVNSYTIGDQVEGVGAQRQTELVPDGAMRMRETVTEWVTYERMVVAMDQIEQQPVKQATMTFSLAGGGDTTTVTMSYDYEPADGVPGPMLDEQFSVGFNGFMDSLERAAKAGT